MGLFILRRFGVMLLTALCLTFVVFFLTNLYPNLEKLAKTQGNQRMSDEQVANWLENRGYAQPLLVKYGQWLGVAPGFTNTLADGQVVGTCVRPGVAPEDTATFCGVLQGEWGYSSVFKEDAGAIIAKRLGLTGWLALAAFAVMIGFVELRIARIMACKCSTLARTVP